NFDDGYQSVYDHVYQIMKSAGIRSSQYIITSKIGARGYMSKLEIQEMAQAGHEIGAHTLTHAHLNELSNAEARKEIEGSRNDLIKIGITPVTFAYPFGDYTNETIQILKELGFWGARTTHPGLNTPNTNRFELLRR